MKVPLEYLHARLGVTYGVFALKFGLPPKYEALKARIRERLITECLPIVRTVLLCGAFVLLSGPGRPATEIVNLMGLFLVN